MIEKTKNCRHCLQKLAGAIIRKKTIGVAAYETLKVPPKKLKKELPSPKQVEKLLEFLD